MARITAGDALWLEFSLSGMSRDNRQRVLDTVSSMSRVGNASFTAERNVRVAPKLGHLAGVKFEEALKDLENVIQHIVDHRKAHPARVIKQAAKV